MIKAFLNNYKINFAIYLIFFVLVSACSANSAKNQFELATIDSVSPNVIEPGDILVLTGSGFVEGLAEVILNGTFDPFGMISATSKKIKMNAIAVNSNTVHVRIDNSAMKMLAQEYLEFKGIVQVNFPSALLNSKVKIEAKSKIVSIEFRPAGGGIRTAAKRSREADEIISLFGIEFSSFSKENDLLVVNVSRNSAADRNGIYPGARLLAVDGLALAAKNDLAGLNPGKMHKFEFVSSNGTAQIISAILAPVDSFDMDKFIAVLITAIFAGIFLAFAAPKFGGIIQSSSQNAQNPVAQIFWFAFVSAPVVIVPACIILLKLDADATLLLTGLAIASCCAVILYGKGNFIDRIVGFFVHLLPVLSVVAMGGAAASTFGLWDVIIAQEASLLGLHIWSNPFLLMAVIFAVFLLWPSELVNEESSFIAKLACWCLATVTAMVITVFCLGGWIIPGVSFENIYSGGIAMFGAILVFAVKTWLVIIAGRVLAGAGIQNRRKNNNKNLSLIIKAVFVICLTALALAWEWIALPADLQSAAQILSAGLFFAMVTVFIALQFRFRFFDKQERS